LARCNGLETSLLKCIIHGVVVLCASVRTPTATTMWLASASYFRGQTFEFWPPWPAVWSRTLLPLFAFSTGNCYGTV